MNFEVHDRYLNNLDSRENATIIFEENYWDDFNYRTTYEVYLFINQQKGFKIGAIQIANIDDANNKDGLKSYKVHEKIKEIYNESFECLPQGYVSMGNTDFYEALYKHFNNGAKDILANLNDIAINEQLYEKVKSEEVIKKSFFREISTEIFKKEIVYAANGENRFDSYELKISYTPETTYNEKNISTFTFKVNPDSWIQTNVHAIIGKNGTGKTTILRDIAEQAFNLKNEIKKSNPNLMIKYRTQGKFKGDIFDYFESALYITFSAFDDIAYNQFDSIDDEKSNFSYVGLYTKIEEITVESSEISARMTALFKFLVTNIGSNRSRLILFVNEVKELNLITNFESISHLLKSLLISDSKDNLKENTNSIIDIFKSLSSGHKIIMLSIASLCLKVNQNCLVIIDEPELYLHPPLISQYIRAISRIIQKYNGLCILATHSPIVLQEIPRNNVNVISFSEDENILFEITKPDVETFGENVSTLTNKVFKYDVINSGFYNHIKNLFNENGYERLSEMKLGMDAKLYLKILNFNKERKKKFEQSIINKADSGDGGNNDEFI